MVCWLDAVLGLINLEVEQIFCKTHTYHVIYCVT
jgi:hypothetical protein